MNEGEAHSLSCCGAKTPILTRWLSSVLKISNGFEVLDKAYITQAWHLDQCPCVPFYLDKCQEFHHTSFCSPVALKTNLLFDVHLDE
jgi:hypothetical protein